MGASIWTPGTDVITLSNLSRTSQEFTAIEGQTVFVLLIAPYTVGAENLEVFKNGEKVYPSAVTEITGGTSFALAACTLGDTIEAVVFPATSATFTELAAQAQVSAADAYVSKIAAEAAAVTAASYSTGWQTAPNTFTGQNTFTLPVNFAPAGSYASLQFAGVEAVRFDAGGRLPLASQDPCFSAYLTADQSIPTGVATKVTCASEHFDTAGAYDAATYKFQPTVPGIYAISGTVPYQASVATGVIAAHIYKNDDLAYRGGGVQASAAKPLTVQVDALVQFNGTTDYVELYTYQDSGVAQPLFSSSSGTRFSGHLVRRS